MTALVQDHNATRSGGSATSAALTNTFTSTVVSGNAITVAFAWSVSAGTGSLTSVTDDKGNTYTVDQGVLDAFSGFTNSLAHVLNVTNAPSVITVTVGSTVAANIAIDSHIYEVSGIGSFDTSVSGTNSSTVTLNGAITTAAANDFAWATVATSSPITYTQNNGWTTDFTDVSNGVYFMHNILSASGANSVNATASSSVHHAWVIGALKAAASIASIPLLGQILM